jgi:hypothetical protein
MTKQEDMGRRSSLLFSHYNSDIRYGRQRKNVVVSTAVQFKRLQCWYYLQEEFTKCVVEMAWVDMI